MVLNSTTTNPIPLTDLLPQPYRLVYSVLLLVLSVPITFAGAFLTLDRTRQFAPTSLGGVSTSNKEKVKFRLEGGIGGLLAGFVFGVHLTTLLSLVIINRTSAAALGPIQFLVIWLLSSVLLSFLAARFKYIALPFIGLGGGAAFSLFITLACHPSKLARVVLLGVFAIVSGVLCTLPISKLQHSMLRASAAWLGALGILTSISILANIPSYSNLWARLWVNWDKSWGSSQEKGLTAAFILITLTGCGVDFLLHRQLGECPDAKWDSYLASYAANLPNSHDRPGMYQPPMPIWKKLFGGAKEEEGPIIFPPDKALLSKTTMTPGALGKALSPPPYRAGKLKGQGKKESPFSGNSFQPLNKRVHGSDSSDSSSDEEGEHSRYIPRPWAKRKDTQASLDGVTLADVSSAHSKGKAKSIEGDVIYSDGESVSPVSAKKEGRDAPGWTPEFLKRHSTNQTLVQLSTSPSDTKGKDGLKLSTPVKRGASDTPSPPPGAVPMTPSLLRALDRVSQAQNDAYAGIISRGHTPQATGGGGTPAVSAPGGNKGAAGGEGLKMPAPSGGYDWTKFWRNVDEKANEDSKPVASSGARR